MKKIIYCLELVMANEWMLFLYLVVCERNFLWNTTIYMAHMIVFSRSLGVSGPSTYTLTIVTLLVLTPCNGGSPPILLQGLLKYSCFYFFIIASVHFMVLIFFIKPEIQTCQKTFLVVVDSLLCKRQSK